MPNNAEAAAGIRFKIHDVSATERARQILQDFALEKEISESKRRQKMHTSMLAYTDHARALRNKGLTRTRRRSVQGLVTHPIMQFDNNLALSGAPPYNATTGRLKHLTTNYATPQNSTTSVSGGNAQATKHITRAPNATHNEKTGKSKRMAILKSYNEIIYSNYNDSRSNLAGGFEFADTAAECEPISSLHHTAGVESKVNDVKPSVVGSACIKLRQPDKFHPGILPRPGQGGKRKVTPRYTLDITLPRMETCDNGCVTPNPCYDARYGDEGQDSEIDDEIEQDTTDTETDVDNGAKTRSLSSGVDDEFLTNVTSEQHHDENAQSSNARLKWNTSFSVGEVKESDLNHSESSLKKSLSNYQSRSDTQRSPTSFRHNVMTKEGQSRRYNLHRYNSDIASKNSILVPQNLRLDRNRSDLSDESQTSVNPQVPSSHSYKASRDNISETLDSHETVTLRSILKNQISTDATHISTKESDIKKEGNTTVRKEPQANDKTPLVSKSEIKLPKEHQNSQTSMSYHKAYTVNVKSRPTHMKNILENAIESSKRNSSKFQTQNGSDDQHRMASKPRKVCRHGIFEDSCTICVALGNIQQRIKNNIKSHVSDYSQWNLIPRQKQTQTKWMSSASNNGASHMTLLPFINSTITASDLRRIRRKKRKELKQQKEESIHTIRTNTIPSSVKTISFEGEDNLITQKSDIVKMTEQHGTKSVRFAEQNIYRQMIGYGVQ